MLADQHPWSDTREANQSDSTFPVPGAMAASRDIKDLCEEVTCSICMDYFADPVTISECGHNFCQACLDQYWALDEGHALVVSCPQCKETTQRKHRKPNRALKNMVEIAKKLSLQEQEGVCQKHQEPLKLFCKDHQVSICLVCDKSKEHQNHMVVTQEEACEDYKNQIESMLEVLKAEREKILMSKAEKESQDLLNQTGKERKKIVAEFQQIQHFLEKEEKSFLSQIEEVEKEIARNRDDHMARRNSKLSSLENAIQEMEEKSQKPDKEFLQDIVKILHRSEKEVFMNGVVFPPELTSRIRGFYEVKSLLEGIREQFPASAANITLDPDTAHPQLSLAEDLKSVKKEPRYQVLPYKPQRFDCITCVLGREGFTAGRHFWDVAVGGEGWWGVGVARKSVQRKGYFIFSPRTGIWGVGNRRGQYKVVGSPNYIYLTQKLKRIRVTLNYSKGLVSFSDPDTGIHLFTHSGTFYGETLHPFFYVPFKTHLSLSL